MKYRVIDVKTGKDITDTEYWTLTPDGDLYYSEDDECYNCLSAKAVLVTED